MAGLPFSLCRSAATGRENRRSPLSGCGPRPPSFPGTYRLTGGGCPLPARPSYARIPATTTPGCCRGQSRHPPRPYNVTAPQALPRKDMRQRAVA